MLRVSAFIGAVAASPQMNLLPKAECGQVHKDIDPKGVFNLSISVVGRQGFAYTCSTKLDSAVGHAEEDCVDWVPEKVIKNKEDLNVSLSATDSLGRLATCMQWELVFDGTRSAPDVWDGKLNTDALRRMKHSHHAEWNVSDQPGGHEIGRKETYWQHLDGMSHLSHRCVPKDKPDYLRPGFDWLAGIINIAFPPTAMSILQLRLSHALLASTGVIWSIDRSCKDETPTVAGVPTIYESCVLTLPGFPHCHLVCNQTWSLAPGGIASRGYATRTHHIPSPALALEEFDDLGYGWHGGGVYGDKGCGAKADAVVV